MKDLEIGLLPDFYRIHHSQIFNINNIRKIEDNHVFIGENRIAISEKYRKGFVGKIQEKIIEKTRSMQKGTIKQDSIL